MLLLPRHVPTPRLAPPRHWSPLDKPDTMQDVGLVGLGLADYSPSHVRMPDLNPNPNHNPSPSPNHNPRHRTCSSSALEP